MNGLTLVLSFYSVPGVLLTGEFLIANSKLVL
jgi:hypothetical protein